MEETKKQGIPVLNATPRIHCKVFEDNAGAIEIANVPKMRPRTKHLNIKYRISMLHNIASLVIIYRLAGLPRWGSWVVVQNEAVYYPL